MKRNEFKLIKKIQNIGVMKVILITVALAFDLFNFDTTRYALANLLGEIDFGAILNLPNMMSFAITGIDEVGIFYIMQNDVSDDDLSAWWLTGAWLLGATLNAVLTWWTLSVIMTANPLLGNEVLTREQLITYFPIAVAIIVWITRIVMVAGLVTIFTDETGLSKKKAMSAKYRRKKKIPYDRHIEEWPQVKPVRESHGH